MLLLIKALSQAGRIVASAQMGGQGDNKNALRFAVKLFFKVLGRRAGSFGTILGLLHQLQKTLLVKGFVVSDMRMIHLKRQGNHMKMRILLQLLCQIHAAVSKNFIGHTYSSQVCFSFDASGILLHCSESPSASSGFHYYLL